MKENDKLRSYLIRNFFIILIFVGISQAIIGTLLKYSLIPVIERGLGLEGLLSGNNLSRTLIILSEYFLGLTIRIFVGTEKSFVLRFINSIIKYSSGEDADTMLLKLSDAINGGRSGEFVIKAVLCLLILLIIWLLPYIAGGYLYMKMVIHKVDELERARIKKEEEDDKARNLLLSDIAHDIRTPITSIAGFSKALSDGTATKEQQQEILDSVYRKSMQVSDLVSVLFEYVKLDSKGFELKLAGIDFCELVRECVAGMYSDF